MSCPTCSHTMQRLMDELFWCPRCGTLKTRGVPEHMQVERPKLVDRCRKFEGFLFLEMNRSLVFDKFRTIGVQEAINLPEARPT